MSNDNSQRIKPARFDLPETEAEAKQSNLKNSGVIDDSPSRQVKNPWWHSQFNLMIAVFGLLAIAVLSFIFLTPPPSVETLQTGVNSQAALNTGSGLNNSEAPWDENRRAQARTDAQEILSSLLDSKKYLEERQVANWAPVKFEQSLIKADQGDELYKEQQFPEALATYKAAVDGLNNLYELIPVYVQRKVAAGQQALVEGKSQLANQAFSTALDIEPNNFAAIEGLARANNLDRVLELSKFAHDEQNQFSELDELALLLSAEKNLNDALALDSQNQLIQEQLSDVKALQIDKRYRDAMSRGFNALFVSNYTRANNAFSEALKIKPDDPIAGFAYQQSLASNKTASLQSLLDRAKAFEANEEWRNALSNYETVLQRDPNQISAKLGQIRSGARSDLDSQLRDVLDDVLLLSRTNKKQEAERLLNEAKAIRASGPKLKAQIAALGEALAFTDEPVKVQIVSDALTEVTLRKEGANQIPLGRFSRKNLALKPGRYVISGVRFGFQDERREIDLYPSNDDLQYFEIRCEQPIGLSSEEAADDAA